MHSVGFDLDGTLLNNWAVGKWANAEVWMKALPQDPELVKEVQALLLAQVPVMLPIAPAHIITNRPAAYFQDVSARWLTAFDVNVIQLHMAVEVCVGEDRILRKAYVINELGLEYYFEDEREIRAMLFYLCPNTRVLPPEEALRLGFARQVFVQ